MRCRSSSAPAGRRVRNQSPSSPERIRGSVPSTSPFAPSPPTFQISCSSIRPRAGSEAHCQPSSFAGAAVTQPTATRAGDSVPTSDRTRAHAVPWRAASSLSLSSSPCLGGSRGQHPGTTDSSSTRMELDALTWFKTPSMDHACRPAQAFSHRQISQSLGDYCASLA